MAILKNQEDLQNLRHSCLILMSCFYHLGNMLKPGISAGELDRFAIDFIRKHDAEPSFLGYNGFKYALCTSINSEVVHGLSNDEKIIPDNCIVSLDLGAIYKNMYSDSAKTYIVGTVSEKTKQLVETTEKALFEGIKKIKAGNRTGDLGYAINNVAKKAGFGNVLELGGHGVGYAVHEEPFIQHSGLPGKGVRLFENQVIAVEPMFTMGSGKVDFDDTASDGWTVRTEDNSLSAHSEHTILVTKKGCEVLTDIPLEKLLIL
ncbi:MAG: type I methionyl aminopeptidase [candidate division SR1 bacterium]|nr:type I methionyl aminopeptidase [candidate division SR1 bacterium]